ncbi:uncharacterized protein LOC119546914 [Drosophila subpulchrella]|uniref:uncharacterized protein LOC119546914 n=1 Tax=Drosophila subpulchrella TaxID=1486046 RepID=UPI0018A13885|nr:uncharacterized protein LOC119546914 [Drosophila subpulchrella]
MISVALVILCLFPCVQNEYLRPPYQVLLHKNDNLGVLNDGHCFGNIIQSRLVLTAASCLLSANKTSNGKEFVKSDELAVSFKGEDLDESIYFVSGIDIYPGFNESSLDNDIAILSLSTQLPLSERNDIQWVLVADYDLKDSPLEDGVESYIWKISNEENVYPGYGVIRESNLVGIISFELPSKSKRESNLEIRNSTRFTQLNSYLSWIYALLQSAEIADIENNNYSASLPYRQRKSAEIVKEYVDSDAVYFQEPVNPIEVDFETEVEDLTETDTENVEVASVDVTNPADTFNENIENEKGFLTNAANMFTAKGISLWILILNVIAAQYRLLKL